MENNNENNKKQITHKQHVIPRSIQKHFSNDGKKIYGIREIFDIKKNLGVQEYSISTLLCEKDIYEFPIRFQTDKYGENYLEDAFAKNEERYQQNLKILIGLINEDENAIKSFEASFNRKYNYSFNDLKEYIKEYMILYFLMFYYRSYWNIKLGNKSEDEERQKEIIFGRFLKTLFDDRYLDDLSETILEGYDMYLLISNHDNFLLSDNFICTASIDFKGTFVGKEALLNRSIGLKNIYILIPLTSKYYLLFTDEKQKSKKIKLNDIDILKFNSIIYRNSFEYTLGKNKEMLQKVFDTTTRYSYGFDIVANNIVRSEIWVNENFDKIYYTADDLINEIPSTNFYAIEYKYKSLKEHYVIEKNFGDHEYCGFMKMINRNPNIK